jgi:hypothetical protein
MLQRQCPSARRRGPAAARSRTRSLISVRSLQHLIPGCNEAAERDFAKSLEATGLTILDNRDDVMFSRQDFFNTNSHLDAEARQLRTDRLIAHLRSYVPSGPLRSF